MWIGAQQQPVTTESWEINVWRLYSRRLKIEINRNVTSFDYQSILLTCTWAALHCSENTHKLYWHKCRDQIWWQSHTHTHSEISSIPLRLLACTPIHNPGPWVRWTVAYRNNHEHSKTVFPHNDNYREADIHTLSLSLGKEQKNAHMASSWGSRVYCKPTHPFDTITPVTPVILCFL